MKPRDEPLAQQILDDLVEGELSPAERRSAILQLETEPGGWRRCSLAFLEAQTWRKSLKALVAASDGHKVHIVEKPAGPRGRRRQLGTAVSAVLVAFALGIGCGKTWLAEPQRLVDVPKADASRQRADNPRERADYSADGDRQEVAGDPAPEENVSPKHDSGVRLVGMVKFGGEKGVPQTMPVLAGPNVDRSAVYSSASPLSKYDREQLLRRGWRVIDERKQVVSVANADGSQVTIPYYRIRCQYVGDRVY